MSFNSSIGSVNFLETTSIIIPPIRIVKPAIKYKKLFEIRTLSSIAVTGILKYNV